jgi:hypothetical protein
VTTTGRADEPPPGDGPPKTIRTATRAATTAPAARRLPLREGRRGTRQP